MHTNKEELFGIFKSLVKIPSPSLSEDKVIDWILDFCKSNDIKAETDNFKNIHITVPATDTSKHPMAFSSHMDVVGDFSPINLVEENGEIKTDGKRTLGADDKAGVSCALYFAKQLKDADIKHGGLEILFTRDEENHMSGIKHMDFSTVNSKHILVLDGEKAGNLEVSGASYTFGLLKVTTPYGGHSGNDIHEKHRLNAAKLIAELITNIPQGVFFKDETGTITSINLGTIIAGNIQNTACKIVDDNFKTDNFMDYFMDNSVTNVINTEAQASYSIRSASAAKENELKKIILDAVEEFNSKYDKYAHAEINFRENLPPFEKSQDPIMEEAYKNACKTLNHKPVLTSFHAGAETHIYAKNKNKSGEKFSPVLFGVADIYNMHSNAEYMNIDSFYKGYEFVKEIFIEFNKL